jgi:hypothetical protein
VCAVPPNPSLQWAFAWLLPLSPYAVREAAVYHP